MATHDVELVAQVATRAVVLAEGEVVADGPARDVVCHSPVFAPQVAKVLAPEPWLTVDEVRAALELGEPSVADRVRRSTAGRAAPAPGLGAAGRHLAGRAWSGFCWPLLHPRQSAGNAQAHSADAPWIFIAVLPLLLAVVLSELAEGSLDAKAIALLGILAACGAALRVPSPGVAGFEPVFFLLIPAGRVLGRGFGFVLGALTIVVSALITGGVGPWLPVPDVRGGLDGLRGRLPPAGPGQGRDRAAGRLRRRGRHPLRHAAQPLVLAVRRRDGHHASRSSRGPGCSTTSTASCSST